MREIRVHGQSKRYVHTQIGVGGRMDTLQCAIVLAKLERFDWEIEQRRAIGAIYQELFANKIKTITQKPDRTSVYGQFTVLVEDRDKIQTKLKEFGIPTAVHYPIPMHLQPAYQNLSSSKDCINAVDLSKKVISLPMGADLSNQDQINNATILINI
jgi:UDP-2-acetamido-2-deoxy-ribo-hexuluronate aminotransferase